MLLGILSLAQLSIGLLVFLESQRTKQKEQRIFAFLSLVVVIWMISVATLTSVDIAGSSENKTFLTLANQLAFLLSSLILVVIYYFNSLYPLKRTLGKIQKVILGFGVVLTLASPLPIVAGTFTVEGSKLIYHYGPLASLIGIMSVVMLVSIYKRSYNILKTTHEKKLQKQALTLVTGVSLTVLQTVLFVIVLPSLFGQSSFFYLIGYSSPFYLIAFTGYGLIKQGLFDIRLIVARSVAYFFLFTITTFLYIAPVVLLTSLLLDAPLKVSTLIYLGLISLAIAISFQPLKQYFNKLTNRLFYRDYYDPQDVMDKITDLLVRTVDIDEIKVKSKEIIEETVRPSFLGYVLASDRNAEMRRLSKTLLETDMKVIDVDSLDRIVQKELYKTLRKSSISLAIRLRTTQEDLGFMVLGFRRSGAGYSVADRRLLSVVADQVAIGLQNALRFEEIENFNITLQERITEATKKLRRTNEKLRTLDQTKDDFISMASHQLRTPLTSVKGYVSMVLEGDAGKVTPLQRKLLNQSFVSSQRMVYLISDLLNVSRLRTGKFVIEATPTNLAKVIQDEVEQLKETAKGRNLTLTFNHPEHFSTYMLDETKMRQVIMNFIDNAIYYTPSGGHITINLVEKPQQIEFTVVDDGIGVPKDEQHHLFSKFYRAHNAKRARPDGTGLGLFMAKKVIVAQGGATIFKSQENRGSTFGFSFAKEKLTPDSPR